jgi:hypothetical protein
MTSCESDADGVRLDADDPVLIAALLNQRLLDEAIGRLEAAVRASADRMTTAATRQMEGARDVAATFVTRVGEWSAERLQAAADEGWCRLTTRSGTWSWCRRRIAAPMRPWLSLAVDVATRVIVG